MKKLLVLGVILCLGKNFMHADGDLRYLNGLYEWWQGESDCWPVVYEYTKDFVQDVVKDETYVFDNIDLMSLEAFLYNEHCLIGFLKSEGFKEKRNQYDVWIKNLFRLTCKAAINLKKGHFPKNQYYSLLDSSSSIQNLCDQEDFQQLNKKIRKILDNNIDWGDD